MFLCGTRSRIALHRDYFNPFRGIKLYKRLSWNYTYVLKSSDKSSKNYKKVEKTLHIVYNINNRVAVCQTSQILWWRLSGIYFFKQMPFLIMNRIKNSIISVKLISLIIYLLSSRATNPKAKYMLSVSVLFRKEYPLPYCLNFQCIFLYYSIKSVLIKCRITILIKCNFLPFMHY